MSAKRGSDARSGRPISPQSCGQYRSGDSIIKATNRPSAVRYANISGFHTSKRLFGAVWGSPSFSLAFTTSGWTCQIPEARSDASITDASPVLDRR